MYEQNLQEVADFLKMTTIIYEYKYTRTIVQEIHCCTIETIRGGVPETHDTYTNCLSFVISDISKEIYTTYTLDNLVHVTNTTIHE